MAQLLALAGFFNRKIISVNAYFTIVYSKFAATTEKKLFFLNLFLLPSSQLSVIKRYLRNGSLLSEQVTRLLL